MADHAAHRQAPVFGFAFGYFACYVLYATLTRLAAPETTPAAPSFSLLAGLYVGVMLTVLPAVCVIHRLSPGRAAPGGLRTHHVVAGLCSAVIVVTTTLAYGFAGVSILLALLLMRGGVLLMSPVLDWRHARRPTPATFAALGLSVLAVILVIPSGDLSAMPAAAWINLSAYLLAYGLRLDAMTRFGKFGEHGARSRFFVREQTVALVAMSGAMAAALALPSSLCDSLAAGFERAVDPRYALYSVGLGAAYGLALCFGSLIYLDRRSNAFAVSLNRGASVAAGFVASGCLVLLTDQPGPSTSVMLAAGLVLVALAILGARAGPDESDRAPRTAPDSA
ncbi:MAG: hypothetical protein AAF610_08195 [Pseudomonadota bacterium]